MWKTTQASRAAGRVAETRQRFETCLFPGMSWCGHCEGNDDRLAESALAKRKGLRPTSGGGLQMAEAKWMTVKRGRELCQER
jgi:hypothetical protein